MRHGRQVKGSDLFLVRLWVNEAGDGERELRGNVQRVVNGESYHFRNLLELEDLLRSMMPGGQGDAELPEPGVAEE